MDDTAQHHQLLRAAAPARAAAQCQGVRSRRDVVRARSMPNTAKPKECVCGVPVLCPRVPVMDQREPMETNEQRRAKSPTYNTSAYLRVGAGRSENPGVGGSIPSPPTNFFAYFSLQLGLEVLPLLLLFSHEVRKARTASDAVEVGVLLEQRVAWKSVFCGLLQIPHCQPRLVHARVGRPDDVRRVVEVLIAFLFGECGLNPFFGLARVSRSSRKQSLQAREQPSSVLRVLAHELRNSLFCLELPPELEQGERRLETPKRRAESLSIANGRQRFFV